MFTKVLMKYLEAKNPKMHADAKIVIRDCAKKNKDGVAGYQSLSASMQSHLRSTVGEAFWKKAEDYLAQYLCDQYKKKNGLDPTAAEQKSRYVTRKAAEPLRMENH